MDIWARHIEEEERIREMERELTDEDFCRRCDYQHAYCVCEQRGLSDYSEADFLVEMVDHAGNVFYVYEWEVPER